VMCAKPRSATISASGIGAGVGFPSASRILQRCVLTASPDSSHDGSVVAAVRAELDAAPEAAERPGLAAAALVLAAILDDPKHFATQPAAARQLVAILGMLSKRARRRGKLAVVKSMTASGQRAD
jgi:hypothetical protein